MHKKHDNTYLGVPFGNFGYLVLAMSLGQVSDDVRKHSHEVSSLILTHGLADSRRRKVPFVPITMLESIKRPVAGSQLNDKMPIGKEPFEFNLLYLK